jgi:anthranilate synthase component 1
MSLRQDSPTTRRFSSLARRYNLVPVVRELMGDLETPVSALLKLRAGHTRSFLLESVEGGENWGRYSILGTNPRGRFRARGQRVLIEWDGRKRTLKSKSPLRALGEWLRRFRAAPVEGLPRFFGGAVGSISYDAIRGIENIPDRHRGQDDPEELDFFLVTDLVVFDNLSNRMKLVACATIEGDARAALQHARARLDAMEAALAKPLPEQRKLRPAHSPRLRSSVSRREFGRAVKRATEYIRAGDCFQIVLSRELRCKSVAPAFEVYRALRVINPSPYMFYFDYGKRQLVGASPEVLVRVESGRAELRPIAGTRMRGKTAREDEALIAELLADEKERAEHVMLVDLGRNDLGRVCRYGSVRTDELMVVEKYSHVIHLVSHVSGELREDRDCFDALAACFPAGTVSGAPKIRAMEIIDELETRRRGHYAGAVGYVSFAGSMDTCIAIRTMVKEDGVVRLGVGAGIVLDSLPQREFEETNEKAGALRQAIEWAERGELQ